MPDEPAAGPARYYGLRCDCGKPMMAGFQASIGTVCIACWLEWLEKHSDAATQRALGREPDA